MEQHSKEPSIYKTENNIMFLKRAQEEINNEKMYKQRFINNFRQQIIRSRAYLKNFDTDKSNRRLTYDENPDSTLILSKVPNYNISDTPYSNANTQAFKDTKNSNWQSNQPKDTCKKNYFVVIV